MSQTHAQSNEPGTGLGWSLIFTLVGLQVAALWAGVSVKSPMGEVLIGTLFLELGFIVLVSYFYPQKSFFFRWLMSIIERHFKHFATVSLPNHTAMTHMGNFGRLLMPRLRGHLPSLSGYCPGRQFQ